MQDFKLEFLEPDEKNLRQASAWIVFRGQRLSAECVRAKEVEEAAEFLKHELDQLVSAARRKLP